MFANKSLTIKTVLMLLVVLVVAAACTAAQPGQNAPAAAPAGSGITVVGHGEATSQPDQAQVQVGVETFAASAEEATTQNEATIQAIMTALEAQGIAREDIATSNYSLWAEQKYGENGPEGIAGYRVSNQVTVTIHDISKVGDVLAAATNAGANSIYGVNFSVEDPAALEASAREKAIADARARAESLAALAGVELGEVVAISEITYQPPMPFYGLGGARDTAAEAPAPSIVPGETTFQMQIQVTFAIP